MGYQGKVLFGASWLVLLKIVAKGIGLLKIFILARLLSPEQFGLFGVVAIALALTEMLTETGINTFLIHKAKQPSEFYNTALLLSILRGIIISAVLVYASLIIPGLYAQPELSILFLCAASIPLVRGWINPAVSRFQREFAYHKDVWIRVIMILADAGSTVVAALILRSPLAFIVGQLVGSATEVVLTWLITTERPKIEWDVSKIKKIVGYGKWITSSNVLGYLAGHLDDVLVSVFAGVSGLGLYQNAFKLTQAAAGEYGDLGAQAIFPAISRVSNDRSRLVRAFWKSVTAMSFILLIPTLVLIVFRESIVRILLGEQWIGIIPLLVPLSLSAYFQGVNQTMYPFHIVRERPELSSFILIVYLIAMVGGIAWVQASYGLFGIAWAILGARMLIQPLLFLSLRFVLVSSFEKKAQRSFDPVTEHHV